VTVRSSASTERNLLVLVIATSDGGTLSAQVHLLVALHQIQAEYRLRINITQPCRLHVVNMICCFAR
jgi:hypothetical protein